jgi:signal peptidase I
MPGGDLPLKNNEYINEALENSRVEAENNSDELTPEEEIAEDTPEGSEQSLPDENESKALLDEPTLFDENECETPFDEPPLLDEDEIETQIDEASLPIDDTEAIEEDISVENDGTDTEVEVIDDLTDDAEDDISEDENEEKNEALPSTDEDKTKEDEEKPRRVDNLFDFIELFVFTLAAVFIITSFFFRYSIVDGGSMQNTLQDDEGLILRSIFYTPECGDIVVVQDKSTVLKDPIVKRVIALGGQTVRFTRDAVYVDGVKLDEPYVYTADYDNPFGGEDIYRYSVYPSDALLPIVTDREDGVFYEVTVPDGEIFVMGDHRNLSKDSRDVGTLREDAVIGKVVLRFLPFNKFGKIE